MGHLNKLDRQTIKQLIKLKLLQSAAGRFLKMRGGIIMISCSDGDELPDIFGYMQNMERGKLSAPRIHTIGLNGGALLVPANTALNKRYHEDKVILKHLKQAVKLKNIKTIAIYVHAPCGVAYLNGLNIIQVIDLLITAKTRIKKALPGVTVGSFCHVDDGQKKRTYFVSRDRWLAWRKNN